MLYSRVIYKLFSVCFQMNSQITSYISESQLKAIEQVNESFTIIQYIHALNTLRLFYNDSDICKYIHQYIDISFIIACEGLNHVKYDIRVELTP